ncbi:hypothetical protein [Haloarcula sp. H-GB5]|jgi:hypothetical protein
MPNTSPLLKYILNDKNKEPGHINNRDELRDAIRKRDETLFSALAGKQITRLAKTLSWDDYNFTPRGEQTKRAKATILEEVNNKTLSVLAPDGVVYQLGDIIRFEATTSSVWGGTKSQKSQTYRNQIDFLSNNTASISRMPTYSNPPSDSPTAYFSRTDIELVSRSNLQDYRDRYTEGSDIDIPSSVNGWELTETKTYEKDQTTLPTNLVTRMQWSNGESTYITAQWRGGYSTWRLSTPCEGVLTGENIDEYLYEIDVPQQVVRTDTIITLATAAMKELDPNDFQDPYDLRKPEDIEHPNKMLVAPVPVKLPAQVGDWSVDERRKRRVVWKNTNPQSAWSSFTVKIDYHGGVSVRNEAEEESHDRRLIEKYSPNGTPFNGNIEADYAWRRREMFRENWFYGIAFMIQSSRTPVENSTLTQLNEQTPERVDIEAFNHGIDMDPQKTMNRENGTLFAYGQGSQPTRGRG